MFLQHDRLKDSHAGGSRARRQDVFQAVQPHRRLLHPRRGAGPHGRHRRRPTSTRRCADYKSTVAVVARRSRSIPTIAEHREPHRALEARERHEGRGALEEDREQHRHRRRSICASAIRRRWRAEGGGAFAGGLLMAGTKSHTRQQLQEEMRKLNAQINVSGGGGGGGGGAAAVDAAAAAAAACRARTRQHLGAGGELPGGAAAGGGDPARSRRIRRTSSTGSRRSGSRRWR